MSNLSWTQPHTPCNRCVRFATTVASGHATLATKQDATLYLSRTCTGWIAPASRLAHLLNHLVGARRQPGRHVKAERLGGSQVDHELESRRLIDRQVGGLLALENPRDVESGAAIAVWNVVAIAHQPARRDIFAVGVHRRDGVTCRQRDDLLPPAGKERIGGHK